MSATKILWGQVITVFLIVLAAIWGATQWTAAALAYQPELGPPWFMAFGWPIYPPPAFFWWWFSFDAYAPHIFQTGAFIAASGGFVSIAVAIGMSVWRARELMNAETYGSARWATEKEVRSAGLLGPNGVVLGKLAGDYLRHDGPEHVLCFAPTRSGKGVGLVIPSLLTWPGSAIVHDIKGENWTLTAGFRSQHGRVLLFDPTNAASAAYNPLLEVRRGQWEVRDVQNVADVLVDPEGSLERRNHWEKTSHSLLVGAILHVLYAEADKTLAGVAAFLSDPKDEVVVIAHEIGHSELHHDPRNEVRNVQAQLGGDSIDSGAGVVEGYSPRERKELQADIFAGEFLCPADWLRTEIVDRARRPSEVAEELGLPYGLVLNQAIRALLLPPLREPNERGPSVLIELDESQKQAATWDGGPLLVDAGPGTGKTRTLVHRIGHVLDQGALSGSILALTFSKKAAEEMRERLSESHRDAAIEMWVGTFHGFGLEMVTKWPGRLGRTAGVKILDQTAQLALLEANLSRLPLRYYQNLFEPTARVYGVQGRCTCGHSLVSGPRPHRI